MIASIVRSTNLFVTFLERAMILAYRRVGSLMPLEVFSASEGGAAINTSSEVEMSAFVGFGIFGLFRHDVERA